MPIDVALLAGQVVSFLSPFLPGLLALGTKAGEKIGETLVEKGGEVAAEQASVLWDRLTGRVGDDPELRAIATVVASDPASEDRQKILVDVLRQRLEADSVLVEALDQAMGNARTLNLIRGGNRSSIEDNEQHGADENRIEGGDESTLRRNIQVAGRRGF
jgi:hypothetical protein